MDIAQYAKKLYSWCGRNLYKILKYTEFYKFMVPKYGMQFYPQQLFFICECIEKIKEVPGDIVEIGCAGGDTALFLNKFMDFQGIEKKYICIDTFSGFTKDDIALEIKRMGKDADYYRLFKINKKKWFDYAMRSGNVKRVTSIKSDICQYSFMKKATVSFCLIDTDLYRPTKCALEKIYPILSKNGIIIIDDCKPGTTYEGAWFAYREFVRQHNLKEKYLLDKLGIIL